MDCSVIEAELPHSDCRAARRASSERRLLSLRGSCPLVCAIRNGTSTTQIACYLLFNAYAAHTFPLTICQALLKKRIYIVRRFIEHVVHSSSKICLIYSPLSCAPYSTSSIQFYFFPVRRIFFCSPVASFRFYFYVRRGERAFDSTISSRLSALSVPCRLPRNYFIRFCAPFLRSLFLSSPPRPTIESFTSGT